MVAGAAADGRGSRPRPAGTVWLEPVSEVEGFWLEVRRGAEDELRAGARAACCPLVGALLDAERQRALPRRGADQPLRGDRPPLRDQRDPGADGAARGGDPDHRPRGEHRGGRAAGLDHGVRRGRPACSAPWRRAGSASRGSRRCSVDDECSVAARVYRERRVVAYDPSQPDGVAADCGEDRAATGARRSSACRSAMARAGAPLRCVGVINLTDRIGGDRFTLSDRKLVTAVANQIGAAVENARLVERDLQQQRLQPRAGAGARPPAQAAALARRCCRATPRWRRAAFRPTRWAATSTPSRRLGRGRVGVMLGDVASHGFSAALVMALVMSAAGIHAAASTHARTRR